MSILVLSQVFPPKHGGSGRWLWELYRRLQHDFRVHVVAGDVTGATEFDRASTLSIERMALEFSSWGVLQPRAARDHARAFAALRRIAQRRAVTVVHCGKALPEGTLGLALRRLTGLPYVVYAHGEELLLAKTSRELRWLTKRVLTSASRVIANSRHTREMLRADWSLPESQIAVMHPGVDTTRFVPAEPDPALRERLGWTGRRVVLTVGALQKRKGQDMMLRAMVEIRKQCPDVLYAIAGEGWERPYLEGIVSELALHDAVQFRGVPDEDTLVSYYQQCDLFALPNRQIGWDIEGFGIVSLEAQACGKPVIVGASGGAPETIAEGVSGLSVASVHPKPIAASTISLLNDGPRRLRMGTAARQRAVDTFSWQRLALEASALFSGDR